MRPLEPNIQHRTLSFRPERTWRRPALDIIAALCLLIFLASQPLQTDGQAITIPAAFGACAIQCIRSSSNTANCGFINLYVPDPACACTGQGKLDFNDNLANCFAGQPDCTGRSAVVNWVKTTLCKGVSDVVMTTAKAAANNKKKTTAKGAKTTAGDPLIEETVLPSPVKTTKKKVVTTKKKTTTTTTEDPFTISLEATPTLDNPEETTASSSKKTSTKSTSSRPNVITVQPTQSTTKYVPNWNDPSSPFPFNPSSAGRNAKHVGGALWTAVGRLLGAGWGVQVVFGVVYGGLMVLLRGTEIQGALVLVAVVGVGVAMAVGTA